MSEDILEITSKIYTEEDLFHFFAGMRHAAKNMPWWARRGWNAALEALTTALCPSVTRDILREAQVRALVNGED